MNNFIFLTLVDGHQRLVNLNNVLYFEPYTYDGAPCTLVAFTKDHRVFVVETQKAIAELIECHKNYKKQS